MSNLLRLKRTLIKRRMFPAKRACKNTSVPGYVLPTFRVLLDGYWTAYCGKLLVRTQQIAWRCLSMRLSRVCPSTRKHIAAIIAITKISSIDHPHPKG